MLVGERMEQRSFEVKNLQGKQATIEIIDGHGGVPLSVIESGSQDVPAIIFIHGLGQAALSFRLQMESSLTDEFRLVAFDLRGHAQPCFPTGPRPGVELSRCRAFNLLRAVQPI